MAHGVKSSPRLIVHQALHGYSDGHRQLAISVPLKPRDEKALLILSDISGAGVRLDELGYLTGYPLPESGYFALGRTWPAPEMSRPGCVWTHTLLIDFNDLATQGVLSGLLEFFKRPYGSNSFQDYSLPKEVNLSSPVELSINAKAWANSVLLALYARPLNPIVAVRSSPEVDSAVLAIWSQQWPRLRRNFRFCTLAGSDRSVEGARFDLQLQSETDRYMRRRFPDAVDANDVHLDLRVRMDEVFEDLESPDRYGLRTFFRRLGPDLPGSREVFLPMCWLHQAIPVLSKDPMAVSQAITILKSEPQMNQARTARSVIVSAALELLERLDDSSFDFVWSNLNLVEPAIINRLYSRLGQALWRRNPERLVALLDRDNAYRVIVDCALMDVEIHELITGLKAAPQLRKLALVKRPELVGEPSTWLDDDLVDVALKVAAENPELHSATVTAMLTAGRSDLAAIAVQTFGSKLILEVLGNTSNIDWRHIKSWLRLAAYDLSSVSEFLNHSSSPSKRVLLELARTIPPDSITSGINEDPWLMAWRGSVGDLNESDAIYLFAYFLIRALGDASSSKAELAQLSFEVVHNAVANNQLSHESWKKLSAILPEGPIFKSWDRCLKLRMGVTDMFVNKNLAPECFLNLTLDSYVLYQMTKYAARNQSGRKYLLRLLELDAEKGAFPDASYERKLKEILSQYNEGLYRGP